MIHLLYLYVLFFFFFNDTATTEIYTLSLHDALPILALMGDDHTAESSTVAHQSEFAFVDVMIPILNPAGVQEILDYGLYGYAMSRFCGTWMAMKCVKDRSEERRVGEESRSRWSPYH